MSKRSQLRLIVACFAFVLVARDLPVRLAAQAAPTLPTIMVLATGGTIAGAASTNVQAGYTSGQVGVEQLIAAVPEAKKIANLKGEQVSKRETWGRILSELRRLRELDRSILQARMLESKPFNEIARRLGQPVDTVKSIYYRAAAVLRERIGGAAPA